MKNILLSLVLAAAALSALPTAALGQAPDHEAYSKRLAELISADDAERERRIALTGDLGFPPLPPVTAESPMDSMMFADRRPVGQGPPPGGNNGEEGSPPVMFDGFLPAGAGGTGTIFPEIFKYQLGNSYDEFGPAHPLLVCYHGFGFSASSVANQSTLDEECDTRGWIYMAPTGIDDQLFGPPLAQQNVAAAIQWMIDNHNVDPDRIYMVGFSMGGGVVTNFASRYRDPDGIMIAAVGTVSATLDWVQEYSIGSSSLQLWMENEYNFDGTPAAETFAYHQASSVVFNSYPPMPGFHDSSLSMSTNLLGLPVYITYDNGDTITHVPGINDQLETMMINLGANVTKTVQTGTVDPDFPWIPAPHSWAVLDEDEMCDFFEVHSVDRYPNDFLGQQDLGGTLAWTETTQTQTEDFTYLDGSADSGAGTIEVDNVENATAVTIDVTEAGVTSPVQITATSGDVVGFELTMTNFDLAPSYLVDATSGQLITGVNSDPANGSLIVDVPPGGTIDVDVIHRPEWTTSLTTTPNPVPIGTTCTFDIDAPSTSTNCWFILAVQEIITPVKGVVLTAFPGPPAFLLLLPLDVNGDISFPLGVPNDPGLQGIRIPLQILALNSGGQSDSVSNLWGWEFE